MKNQTKLQIKVIDYSKLSPTPGEQLPLKITLIDRTTGEEFLLRSSRQTHLLNWRRRFYSRKGFLNFSKKDQLLACTAVAIKQGYCKPNKTSSYYIDMLTGFEFPGVVVDSGGQKFIDWVETFILNGLKIPSMYNK